MNESEQAPPGQAGQDQEVAIQFKVPQEAIADIELRLYLSLTIEQVKQMIEKRHPMRPRPSKQKIFFSGKLLSSPNDQLKHILAGRNLEEKQIFHLSIYSKVKAPARPAADQHVSVDSNTLAGAAGAQDQPLRPLTKEEIFLSSHFIKYEKDLIKEYHKTMVDLGSKRLVASSADEFGHYQQQGLDTNLSAKDHLLLTQLPLMDRGFQERMHFFTTANNISANVAEFNENIMIRFLGYDSILQFTLLAKLLMFMMLFGMNAHGVYRWMIIALLLVYYFHRVRTLYIEHYERQRRLLNLVPANQNANGAAQNEDFLRRGALGAILCYQAPNADTTEEQLEEQRRNKPIVVRILRIIIVLAVHFVLSLHHDWIDGRLRNFDRERNLRREREAAARAAAEAAAAANPAQPELPVQQPVEPPQRPAVEEDDDILFQLNDDDLKSGEAHLKQD